MKRKYERRQDGNRLEVEFGGEVTLVRLVRTFNLLIFLVLS